MGKYNTRQGTKRIQRNVNLSKESLPNAVVDADDEISSSTETSKKRKASFQEYEKEAKRNRRISNNHDRYCWKCHRVDTEIGCSTCPRAFHSFCIKSKINEDGNCYVCQEELNAKVTTNIDDESLLSKILLHIIDTACPMDGIKYKPIVSWPNSERNEKLICKKDFRLIHDRCMQRGFQYESHVELINDVKWIHHNCIVVYGETSSVAKLAKKVLEVITLELSDAIDCPECYWKKIGNEALTFLNICKTPHPLVWARMKFHPYWPAKCLRVVNGKAHVRFFGTHQLANLPLSNVLALSKEYPSSSVKKTDLKLENSLNELKAYVDTLQEDNQETFPYKPVNTPFNFEKEEKAMKELLNQRRVILSGDTFAFSENVAETSPPAIVDLTDDAHEPAENSSKTVESIEQAISGSLLPSNHSPDHQNLNNWLSQPSPISISNVMSGTEVPMDSSPDLFSHSEAEPVIQNNFVMSMPSPVPDPFQNTATFSQNSISPSSNSALQLCLRNYDRTTGTNGFGSSPHSNDSVDDGDIEIVEVVSNSNDKLKSSKHVECILQAILRYDPRFLLSMKQANLAVQQLLIHFWGNSSKLKSPEDIIQSQEYEIRTLKAELEEMRRQISLMKDDYEERIRNADKILRSLKSEVNKLGEKLKDREEELKKQNEKVDILRKGNELLEKTIENNEKVTEEKIREAKSFKYPKENEVASAGNVAAIARGIVQQSTTVTVCKQSVETFSLQSHTANQAIISSSTPQQSSSASIKGVKMVSAKKTVARNINSNQSSDKF